MYNKSFIFPCIESPIRCLLSSTWDNKYLCIDKRDVSLRDERDVWCEWYIFPATDSASFHIQNSKTKQFLSISKEDCLIASKMKRDKWYMEKHPTADRQYLFIHEENGEPLGGGDSSKNILSFSSGSQEKKPEKLKNIWTMEVFTGELCFLSPSAVENEYVGCDLLGKIFMTQQPKGWEVWRFMEVGEGLVKISSWTHLNRYLCVDQTGLVHATDTSKSMSTGKETSWNLQKAPKGFNGVTIQDSSTGDYLLLEEGKLTTTHVLEGSSCVWHLTSANLNKYYMYSNSLNKQMVSNKIKPFAKHALSQDMPWTIRCMPDGTFSLYTESNQGYLGCDKNGSVSLSPYLQDYEKWIIQETKDENFYIISKKHDLFLHCGTNGKIHAISKANEFDTPNCKWRLEIAMPPTLSGEQILSKIIAGVAGVVTGVAIMTPASALGAACVANLGHVGCIFGSTIASDALFVASGTAAIMGGVFAGDSVRKLTNASLGKKSPGQIIIASDYVIDEPVQNRPFCAWKTW